VKLILASASPARRRMLEAAGVPFEVRVPDFDEGGVKASLRTRGLGAAELAGALAAAKAEAVSAASGETVLGSDQTLELDDGSMLDKAGTREELERQLRRLSGRAHRLHAAAGIVEAGECIWQHVESVTMVVRPLGDEFVRDYLNRAFETVRWSVGGYHIEGRGAQLFERVEGSHFAVQGLPLLPLLQVLRDRGLLAS
jgi:septum formation protein